MVRTLFAQKKGMQQIWTAEGKRLPVTKLSVSGNVVTRPSIDGESTKVQIAFGDKKLKNVVAPQRKLLEKIGVLMGKRVYKETTTESEMTAGQEIRVESVITAGDILKVSGPSKGKGFAGVVKRHGFAGGPHTHGQSDRERAPGSIGQRTTPGRVFPGMRMAGRMGGNTNTLETVQVVAVDPQTQTIWVKGTLPGAFNTIVTLIKQGTTKEFVLTPQSEKLLGIQAPVAEEAAVVPEEAAVAEAPASDVQEQE